MYYRNNKHTKYGNEKTGHSYMITSWVCAYKTHLLLSLDGHWHGGYSIMSKLNTDPNDCSGDISVRHISCTWGALLRDAGKAVESHPWVSVTDTRVTSCLHAMDRIIFLLIKPEGQFWRVHAASFFISAYKWMYVVQIYAMPYHDWRQIHNFDHKMVLKRNDW